MDDLQRTASFFARELLTANLPKQDQECDRVSVLGQLSGERYEVGDGWVLIRHEDHDPFRLCLRLRDNDYTYYPAGDFQLTVALYVRHAELDLLRTAGWGSGCYCGRCRSFQARFKRDYQGKFASFGFRTAKRLQRWRLRMKKLAADKTA